MSLAHVMRATVELAVRLDRVRPGTLDGPAPDPLLARRIGAEPPSDPRELAVTAERLRHDLAASGLPAARRRYVDALLAALECRARTGAGERPGYLGEVRALFGIEPRRTDPDEYREVHRRLDALLPGRGPVATRLHRYREGDVVPAGRVAAAVTALTAELRVRTRAVLGLPDGERADVELVGERTWSAFTRYRGGLRSRVSLSTATAVRAGALLPLLAHEIYPGHHTQYCHSEVASARYPELALRLVHAPPAVIAEGAAEAAAGVVPGPGWGPVAQDVLAGVGVVVDGELAERVETELDRLGRVRQDAALLRHVDGAGPDEVVAHLMRWLLVPEQRARRILGFTDHPQWRAYPVTYAEGGPLVRAWLARHPASPAAGLRTLLNTPVLPSDLVTQGGDTPDGESVPEEFPASSERRARPRRCDEWGGPIRVSTAQDDGRR